MLGATVRSPVGLRLLTFISIHAPVLGATLTTKRRSSKNEGFQSTHPCWVRQRYDQSVPCGMRISIHAPVLGATTVHTPIYKNIIQFQSTHPCWVRLYCCSPRNILRSFQSTHPCWVRQATVSRFFYIFPYFNPRTRAGCDSQCDNSPK